jgi:hypothetical protein
MLTSEEDAQGGRSEHLRTFSDDQKTLTLGVSLPPRKKVLTSEEDAHFSEK